MWAATGAVRKMKATVATRRALMPNSSKCSAAASSIQPTPSVEDLVLADMRIYRSGMVSTP